LHESQQSFSESFMLENASCFENEVSEISESTDPTTLQARAENNEGSLIEINFSAELEGEEKKENKKTLIKNKSDNLLTNANKKIMQPDTLKTQRNEARVDTNNLLSLVNNIVDSDSHQEQND
jgi:hypothetical protein